MTTNAECHSNREEIYKRIARTETDLAQIKGGVNVLKWLLPIMFAFVCGLMGVMIRQRFDDLEKQIDSLSDKRTRAEVIVSTGEINKKEMIP